MSRRDELASGLAAVRERIAVAAASAGRDPADITLIAVTKTWPATDVRLLSELGVSDVGENRDQEAAAKHAACGDLPLRWHFIGQVQRNKAASITSYADVVHSVDRTVLVEALDHNAERHARRITALVQVALDDTTGRGGVPIEQVADVAGAIAASQWLTLGGVMAVAPLGADPDAAFARLAAAAGEVRATDPEATIVSAGMSGDLDAAIRHGATHVRIGTALLGHRSPTFG